MRVVRHADGRRYPVLERHESSLVVRDPTTGKRRTLSTDEVERVDADALRVAAERVRTGDGSDLAPARDERALGLLVELVDRGPLPVRDVLGAYDVCESDLHGIAAEYRSAGLIRESEVDGERGYAATEDGVAAVALVRDCDDDAPEVGDDAPEVGDDTP